MDKIAILIPCYNEEKTVGKVIDDCKAYVPDATIYVYDNNSTDQTAKIAKEHGAIVRREYVQGKGNVIRRMFREIDALCYVMVDGDDTYPIEQIDSLINLILNQDADMVVGDRLSTTYYAENKRPFHNFGNSLVRKTINRLFRCNIKDIMTGYRAFGYRFVKSFPVLSRGFEIETEMTIHAVDKNLYIESVPITYRDRPSGSVSKLNTFSDGNKILKTIIRLFRNYKPLKFYGGLSTILSIVSLVFLVPVLKDYFDTGLVERFPTLIVCGFAFLTAIVSLFSGLILENIKEKNKQDFEMELIKIQDRLNKLLRNEHGYKNDDKE